MSADLIKTDGIVIERTRARNSRGGARERKYVVRQHGPALEISIMTAAGDLEFPIDEFDQIPKTSNAKQLRSRGLTQFQPDACPVIIATLLTEC